MNIVFGEDVCKWVADRTGGAYYAGSGQGIGQVKDGELVAGVLYDSCNGHSVHMSCAGIGKRWMTKEYLRFCFSYPFDQLKVNKIIGLVDSTNSQAIRFDDHIGLHLEGVITNAGRHGDLLIYTMTREQCRWIKD